MSKRFKNLPWIFTISGWLSSVLPGAWAAVITSVGGVLLLLLSAGAKIFSNPTFLGAVFIAVLVFWMYIGLVWLIMRRPRDINTFRYGLTFEGVNCIFTPNNIEGALSFSLSIRNFSPGPIRYYIEEFDVQIETRTLPTKYQKDLLQGVLSRGAGRTSTAIPFKLEHIREFMGRRVEGTLEFSIKYGDPDRVAVRRLKMSHKLYLEFPKIPGITDTPTQNMVPMIYQLGFNAGIQSESDDPLEL